MKHVKLALLLIIAAGLLTVTFLHFTLYKSGNQDFTEIALADQDIGVDLTDARIRDGKQKILAGIILNKSEIAVTLVQLEVLCKSEDVEARHNLTAGIKQTDEGYEPDKVPQNTPYTFEIPINGLEHSPSECSARTVSWSKYEGE